MQLQLPGGLVSVDEGEGKGCKGGLLTSAGLRLMVVTCSCALARRARAETKRARVKSMVAVVGGCE